MASAEVMAMPVDTPTGDAAGKERQQQAAAEDAGAAQDVYVKLKSLQKHMEFLDIQVTLSRQVRRFLYQVLRCYVVAYRDDGGGAEISRLRWVCLCSQLQKQDNKSVTQ